MANTSSRRTVSRPGVNTEGSNSGFRSPYQPPNSAPDFAADMTLLDPSAYTVIHVGDYFWRVKVPSPSALGDLNAILESKGGEQIKAINAFLRHHMHPDDFAVALRRLMDPEGSFGGEEYTELYRRAVTVGTARPFPPSSVSPALLSAAGELCVPSWVSVAYPHR